MRKFAYKQTDKEQTRNLNTETTLSSSSVDNRGSWPITSLLQGWVYFQVPPFSSFYGKYNKVSIEYNLFKRMDVLVISFLQKDLSLYMIS